MKGEPAEDETGVDSISGKTRKQLYEEAGLEWYGSEHPSTALNQEDVRRLRQPGTQRGKIV